MKDVRVKLSDELYDEIKELITEKGVTWSEFFRGLYAKQSGVEFRIDFADIDEYAEEIEKLTNQISGVCATIYRTNTAYEQDVKEILRLIQKIDKQSDDIWRYVMDARTDLYNDTRKKLYSKVSENSYKRRRKKMYSEKERGKKNVKESCEYEN